ncbi:helix-turn-helix domain-containing protein [Flavobacterium xinjiangense]|uniref:DNA binding domain-containing protein, excisionase family n=1 Tax=Flavobacterium xinjiangense TaxID=178356 RepID=A0A1M7H2C0_9FLAO|nr:helix-turn-helix domain-containing protein [Flavobacterium xinjiangense]SHM22765.1 DNA binding domain-containing protein, excisionase family [Flavobacterium xinjiangense]
MENPFELILERLDRIEKAIEKLNASGPLAQFNDPMDIKDLATYLKMSVSAIYKFTSTDTIPHYKNGKRLYFKKEEINQWIFSNKNKTTDDIDREANEYIRKHPRH